MAIGSHASGQAYGQPWHPLTSQSRCIFWAMDQVARENITVAAVGYVIATWAHAMRRRDE